MVVYSSTSVAYFLQSKRDRMAQYSVRNHLHETPCGVSEQLSFR